MGVLWSLYMGVVLPLYELVPICYLCVVLPEPP